MISDDEVISCRANGSDELISNQNLNLNFISLSLSLIIKIDMVYLTYILTPS